MSALEIEKIVYFVRHGQSADNVAPVFQSPDSPLNTQGIQQAKRVAIRIAELDFDTLIASPVKRAKETADEIFKVTQKIPEYSELFVERIKPSSIYSKPYSDQTADKICREWERSLYSTDLRIQDGENFADIVERADRALEFLRSRPEKSLVVVTHGYFLRTLIVRLLFGETLTGEMHRRFQTRAHHTENTGITVIRHHRGFEEAPSWRLWVYNDYAHLG